VSETANRLLTTQEAAEIAGVSDAYIRQLLLEGKRLRGEKFGRQWMIQRAELERWLKERQSRFGS
jgi:excisionase family DNA binding protein